MALLFEPSHLPFIFLSIIFAFTFHEYAHAVTAYRFGDATAYELGRVTLNPMPHVSWIGMIFILLLGFGWARPVPVNRSNVKYPRMMGIAVSAAGPLSNLLIAIAGAAAVYALFATGWMGEASIGVLRAVGLVFFYFIHINMLLFIFNLIPLPPLDGYRIIEDLAPVSLRLKMMKYEPWGIYIFLIIVFITPVFNVTIGPILGQVFVWRDGLMDFMASAFQTEIDWRYMLGK